MIRHNFEDLCNNIKLDNFEDMQTTVNWIAKKLNKHYYDICDENSNIYIVGSVGRGTAIKGTSDLDIIFDLPKEVYTRINDNENNKQSQLLQEIKGVLKEKYPNTDLKGDGQVVVIKFQKYTVELVPGFKQSDGSFKYPDTNDGGSWKITNPMLEIEQCKKMKRDTDQNFNNICNMLRAWKNNNGFKFKGLLIDTLVYNFLDSNSKYKKCGYSDYLELVKDVLLYLTNEDENQKYWLALGSNQQIYNDDGGVFIKKARNTYDKIKDLSKDSPDLNKVLRNIFGRHFPKLVNEGEKYKYNNTEEFIEDKYNINILLNIKINCNVRQKGYREYKLRDMLKKGFYLKRDKTLEFYIENKDDIIKYGADRILWKVKNQGNIAKKRDIIRGEIVETNKYEHKEHTEFDGDHYVEAYIIKNNTCIARGKIDVPIRV